MAAYRLTNEAESDLIGLYLFGFERFGPDQADRYYYGLMDQLDAVAEEPLRFPAMDEVRTGFRRAVYGSHTIWFKVEGPEIVVVRVLGRQGMW